MPVSHLILDVRDNYRLEQGNVPVITRTYHHPNNASQCNLSFHRMQGAHGGIEARSVVVWGARAGLLVNSTKTY